MSRAVTRALVESSLAGSGTRVQRDRGSVSGLPGSSADGTLGAGSERARLALGPAR